LRQWCLTLMAEKRRKVLDDPEMFAAFQALAGDARTVLTLHLDHLKHQVGTLIKAGRDSGEFKVNDLDAATAMVLDATMRFHHPRLVAESAGQDLAPQAETVIRMVRAGLASGVA
jgi:hypothetical protein